MVRAVTGVIRRIGLAYASEHPSEFGLQRILDGSEALIRGRASDD
jgi:hypothetical protein